VILYLDSSAFVKIYINESASEAMREAAAAADLFATSIVAYAEMRSAFARRRRSGDLTVEALARIKTKFEEDWREAEALDLDDPTVRRAGELAELYGLRGFDAVHLASADALREIFGPITFACFDADLSRAVTSCRMMLLS
jgi:predicted nucleic acid-binding protein